MTNIQKTNPEISQFVELLHNNGKIKPFLEDIFLIEVHVAGLYHVDNMEKIFPNIKEGDYLELYREKHNEHDKLAILVKYKGEKIGHVPRKNNEILANLMDGGKEIYGIVSLAFDGEVNEDYPFKEIDFKVFLKE